MSRELSIAANWIVKFCSRLKKVRVNCIKVCIDTVHKILATITFYG